MVNVGIKNKHFLISLLQKALDKEISKIKKDHMYSHNFTKEKPFFELKLEISADAFEVSVLKAEVERLTKVIQRREKRDLASGTNETGEASDPIFGGEDD